MSQEPHNGEIQQVQLHKSFEVKNIYHISFSKTTQDNKNCNILVQGA